MRDSDDTELIRNPIVIVAAPRSGSTLLFSLLSTHPELWSLYTESNRIIEGPFDPIARGADSNALDATDLDPEARATLIRDFYRNAGNIERLRFARRLPIRGRGRPRVARALAIASRPWKRPPIRLVEKSPKNSVRIPFLRALFPDARFLHLTRSPTANIASLIRAWRSDRHKTYPLPPGFVIEGYAWDRWSFVLHPGWRNLDGSALAVVCADQWRACNQACAEAIDDADLRVRYEDLVADPVTTLRRIAAWGGLGPQPFERYATGLPIVQTATKPDPDKWRSLQGDLEAALPAVRSLGEELGYT
jgi:hypothetical protein